MASFLVGTGGSVYQLCVKESAALPVSKVIFWGEIENVKATTYEETKKIKTSIFLLATVRFWEAAKK